MSIKLSFAGTGMFCLLAIVPALRADVLEMQNGDRYSGKVLAVSTDTVVLSSDILGKINVPRSKVASLTFITNAVAPKTLGQLTQPAQRPVTNLIIVGASAPVANTNADLSAAFHQLGGNTNFVDQIRQQMLAGSPEATAKYDTMVSGLLSGQMNLNDLRQQAQASANQLRELKRESPEAGESLDAYLQVLDGFIKETANEPAGATPKSP